MTDPGFPVWMRLPVRRRGPLTQALFGENVSCKRKKKKKKLVPLLGGTPDTPPRSANAGDHQLPVMMQFPEQRKGWGGDKICSQCYLADGKNNFKENIRNKQPRL